MRNTHRKRKPKVQSTILAGILQDIQYDLLDGSRVCASYKMCQLAQILLDRAEKVTDLLMAIETLEGENHSMTDTSEAITAVRHMLTEVQRLWRKTPETA